ncbi:MAG: hypothetical protein HFG27_04550 [Provencibacterium sp.]|nr:hypothetical protein [Provencibacterium sp.]
MHLLVLTGSVYLILTGIRLFAASILKALEGGCIGCPCQEACRQKPRKGEKD